MVVLARIYKCNLCGKEMDNYSFCDSMALEDMLGYESKFDGRTIELDLCPECVDKLIEQCVIPPFVDDNFDDDDDGDDDYI